MILIFQLAFESSFHKVFYFKSPNKLYGTMRS